MFSILPYMSSFSARILPVLVVSFAFLFSCSRESSEPPWETQSHLGSRTYNGGLFPVWITLKEPVSNLNSIRWKTGSSLIAYRHQAIQIIDANTQLILADTAFLYWKEPPTPYIVIDSTKETNDTTYFYRDTVFAIVDGLESLPIVIEVKNILPSIKKFTVGDLDQFGDSTLTIAVHENAYMEISIQLEKSFNKALRPKVTMPEEMGRLKLDGEKSNDTLWVYKWEGPSDTTNKTLSLKIEDSGGYGERLYKVRLIVYTESGSVWVASKNELVKFSSMGTEVARVSSGFKNISDIVVNSNDGRLFVADEAGNFIRIYNTYGKLLYEDSTLFESPTGIAVGVEGTSAWVWVADTKDKTSDVPVAQLRRFEFSGADSTAKLGPGIVSYEMSGAVKGLAVDQYNRDFVWFAITESDTVGFTRAVSAIKTEPKYVILSHDTAWQRPSMISYKNGLAWVADSTRIVAVDPSGKIKAIIKGFRSEPSISACGDGIWASDRESGKVYRFKGPFRGTPADLKYTVSDDGKESYEKFSIPISVSALTTDCSVWIVDKDKHKVVLLDSLGKFKASGIGITSPILGKTLQKWE